MDDRSFMRCVEKRAKQAEDKFREQLADARDEANRYRAEGMDLRDDLDRLQERYDKLEREQDEHQCAPIATIAMPGPGDQANRVTRVPPPPAPAPVAGTAPPGYVPGQFESTIARHTRPRAARTDTMSAAPLAAAVPPPVFAPEPPRWPTQPVPQQKGGQTTAPHPASLVNQRQAAPAVDPYYYDEDTDDETDRLFYGKDYKPRPRAKAAKVGKSRFANQLQAILGNRPNGGRAWTLDPQTPQEWDQARQSLDDAHAANNSQTGELLRLMRRFISTANSVAASDRVTGTKNLSDVQRHAMMQWRAPDWEQVTRWDPQSGTVVKTDTTKAELRNKRGAAGNRNETLRSALSERLGLSVNGQPHPHLGDIASPRHVDHPDLWREYARSITRTPPRGFAFGPDGLPFQRHVRAFLRFAPLFKGTTGHLASHYGQIRLLALIAKGYYGSGLRALGITPNAQPDWSPIEFVPDAPITDDALVVELARRGFTEAEALDASDYAYSWLTDTLVTEPDDNVRQFISGTLNHSSALTSAQPWPEVMQFHYHEAHGRWLPVVPAASETIDTIVSEQSSDGAPPSSAEGDAPMQETQLPPASSTPEGVDTAVEPKPETGDKSPEMEVDDNGTAGDSK